MKENTKRPTALVARHWVALGLAAAIVAGCGTIAVAATSTEASENSQELIAALAANEHAQHGLLSETHDEPSASPVDAKYSVAYLERNWTPTAADTCSAALHASYNTTGPDGKIYPAWHPAQVTDPATGKSCSFGHEHGDDPSTSDIFDWAVAYLSPATLGGVNEVKPATNLPFGYGSEELNDYASVHAGMSMRHEDNAGHKVFVANNVALLDADRNEVTALIDGKSQQVSCDFLLKQHQGSWSPDATSNNAHELIYASKCTDGTEIIATMLSRFGNSNEFNKNCGSNETVTTVGSTLPAGDGGSRLIPTADCLAAAASDKALSTWDLYELWKGMNKLSTSDGTVLATFEPWFGLRNPSRYFDSANSTAATNGISRPLDLAWGANAIATDAWRTPASLEQFPYTDARSPFNGATRDFYILQNQVSAANSRTTWYTDPYGSNAVAEPFKGSIKQHLIAGSATTTATLSGWRSPIVEHGVGNGVHSPN